MVAANPGLLTAQLEGRRRQVAKMLGACGVDGLRRVVIVSGEPVELAVYSQQLEQAWRGEIEDWETMQLVTAVL
jgi:ribosomal 30S subunit maturation factor RimM